MTAKTDALLIRLTPDDRARLKRVAEANYLDVSTWARQVLLQAVQAAEDQRPAKSKTATRRRSTS